MSLRSIFEKASPVYALAKWGGKKSSGTEQTNRRLEDRYSYLTGQPTKSNTGNKTLDRVSNLLRSKVPQTTSPLKGLIGDFQNKYDVSKGRSDALFDENSGIFRSFLGSSGGLDPSRIANIDQDIAGFRNIGKYGAADAAGANRIRGGGVYDEFSKTGGYSEGDKANIRSRVASMTPAFFAGLKRNLEQTNKVQGGFNPGYTSQMSKLSRDAGQGAQEAVRDAEIQLQEKVNEGRKWGTEGMTASERAIVANMLAGLEGASSTEMSLADMIRSGQMFGAQGLEGLRTSPGADLGYGNQLLQAIGLEGDQINQILGLMSGRNPNVNNWDKYGDQIMSAVSSGAAVLSDERSKNDVVNFKAGLKEIKTLNPVRFKYKPEFGGQPDISVMAQELEKVIPEAVTEINGYKHINMHAVIMALINAVKELSGVKNAS